MKVVQIITGSSSFGGAEAHVRDLAIGLMEYGHECIVVHGPPEGLLTEQLRVHGIPTRLISALKKPIHPLWDLISLFQLLVLLRQLRPDLIATHTSKSGFVGRVAARLIGIPSFFTPHGLSFINREDGTLIRFRLIMERIIVHMGGNMIAVCEAERQLAIQHLGISEDSIATIHNGLPDRRFERQPAASSVRIVMIARFDVQKDHATLFRALSRLLHLNWKLDLAGSGPLLELAQMQVAEHGLSRRVSFLNQCPDTPGLLTRSEVFVLATNWEAFPISILEAMRAGLPIVATNVGGVDEAVQDGVNGFLVARGDDMQLAEKLALLIQDSSLRETMGHRSRSHFTANFEWRSMLDKTEASYMSTLPHVLSPTTDPAAII